ncbi:MAG TPA: MFS transporter [Acidimicrobiales bacterium]
MDRADGCVDPAYLDQAGALLATTKRRSYELPDLRALVHNVISPDRSGWARVLRGPRLDEATIRRRRGWTLAIVNLSLFAIVLDNTILNVALPTLATELHASGSELQWIVDAYVLVFAGLLLSAGALGDRFGRRGALSSGLIVFAAGSVFAMHAQSASTLIVARAVMGVGGALIMPATLSILINVFTDPKERAKAIALWASVGGLAIALGPVIGGFLLEHFNWSAVFALNVPIAVIALAAGRVTVPTSRDPEAARPDVVGAVLSIVGLGSLVWAIIAAGEHGWTAFGPLGGFAVAAVASAAFVAWERHTSHPMLDVAFFKNPRFTVASLGVMLGYFALFGSLFLMSQLLQFVLGYSALDAGIRLLPFALAMAVFSTVSPKLVDRFGTKLVVVAGLSIVAAGLLWEASLGLGRTYLDYLPGMLLMGIGVALTWAPTTDSIMGTLPKAKAGVGSAVNDTVREIGGALGVAVLGSVVAARYAGAVTSTTAGLPAHTAHVAGDSLGGAVVVAHQIGGAQGHAILHAAQAAYIHGFGLALTIAAAVAAAGAGITALWLPARSDQPAALEPHIEPVGAAA